MLKITLDTSVLGKEKIDKLKEILRENEFDLATTSVTDREVRGSPIKPLYSFFSETVLWDESEWGKAVWGGDVVEAFVLGESELGKGRLGSSQSATTFETILAIISDGSFPKVNNRENLTEGEKHQLRDAMILEAHTRERRDILISDDVRAYISKDDSKRKKLERLCDTKIMTLGEFIRWVSSKEDRS